MKILVAMSGGVDSSVAAAQLKEEGHDVTGVHMRLSDLHDPTPDGRAHGCCGVADADDARRVAQVLDIPFYVWNLRDEFSAGVVDDFVSEYARGRTPNPCVRCNEKIKFGAFQERALSLGFDAIATGHYARLDVTEGKARLFRSADEAKDQSYVLARLTQAQLSRARFPVGGQTKSETRAIAANLDLRVANKPDSYEICFVEDQVSFLDEALGKTEGEIVSPDGEVLGAHSGVHRYTVGQRRGLGINTGSNATFVLEIDAPRNQIVVGAGELLARSGLEAEDVSWIAGTPPEQIDSVQVRAHGAPIPATLTGDSTVRFGEPQRGIAPGQLVAFFVGDEVLGGGTILRALPYSARL